MSLSNLSGLIDIHQVSKEISGATLLEVVAAVAGKRVKIHAINISVDLESELVLTTGAETLFKFYTENNWTLFEQQIGGVSIFEGEVGQDVSIQSDQSGLSGWIRVVYTLG